MTTVEDRTQAVAGFGTTARLLAGVLNPGGGVVVFAAVVTVVHSAPSQHFRGHRAVPGHVFNESEFRSTVEHDHRIDQYQWHGAG